MRSLPVLLPLAILAACAAPPKAPTRPVAAPKPVAAAVETCAEIARIREARVTSDSGIDFVMNDGRTLRAAMPKACSGLGTEKAFTYSTTLTRLCPTDMITVVNQAGGPRLGMSCVLGALTPVKAAP